jgi:hypothetical protein
MPLDTRLLALVSCVDEVSTVPDVDYTLVARERVTEDRPFKPAAERILARAVIHAFTLCSSEGPSDSVA